MRRRTPSLCAKTTSGRSKGIRSYILPPGTWHGVQVRASSGFTEASKLTTSSDGVAGTGTDGAADGGGVAADGGVAAGDGPIRGAGGGGDSTVRQAATVSSAKATYEYLIGGLPLSSFLAPPPAPPPSPHPPTPCNPDF